MLFLNAYSITIMMIVRILNAHAKQAARRLSFALYVPNEFLNTHSKGDKKKRIHFDLLNAYSNKNEKMLSSFYS
ncbi:hypothetical protein EDM59_08780 [Brevibacillus nitrificans]|uniref:Uncharacterized protein n=1 Tax=Brevibacillus nitrificans TaxID=651560 RepID=A0A3M8DM40_9BACL|nr:hypothetical protein EDM59_08780 [Brevibacillus nitrificans]